MKKLISLLLTAAIAMTAFIAVSADDISVLVNGNEVEFTDAAPFIENGHTLVPMRAIFEALGADVSWDGDTKTVTAYDPANDITIIMEIDSASMLVGETVVELETPARLVDDRTVVPVRAIAEGMASVVDWDNDTRTVIITKEISEAEPSETEAPEVLLSGKSIAFLGDSICYGTNYHGGYAKLIEENENMLVTNIAKGGAAIAKNVTWSDDVEGYRPSVAEMAETLEGEYDYIILQGGVNDFWNHAPVGEITESFDGGYDENTLAGALEAAFLVIKENHPESKAGFVIIHDPFTYDAESAFEPYYVMIKTVCDKWGISYLDLYAVNNTETGVNVKDADTRLTYFASSDRPDGDGIHPNELGYMTIYVEPMVNWLKNM